MQLFRVKVLLKNCMSNLTWWVLNRNAIYFHQVTLDVIAVVKIHTQKGLTASAGVLCDPLLANKSAFLYWLIIPKVDFFSFFSFFFFPVSFFFLLLILSRNCIICPAEFFMVWILFVAEQSYITCCFIHCIFCKFVLRSGILLIL